MAEGVKHDQEKLPYHLLAPEFLEETSRVLQFGAEKYTVNYETEWDRLLDVRDVTGIEISTPKNSVVVVTKNTSEKLTLNLPKDNDKIAGIGRNEIQTQLRGTPNIGNLIQSAVKEIKTLGGENIFLSLDSQNNYTKSYATQVVKSADQQTTFTLTIATKQGFFEASFAQDVTMDSDFWEMIWEGLKKRYNISKPLNQTGARNWEEGMCWSRVFSALMRHMWAWWSGQDRDEETGFSHLSHAACCIMFLIAYESRGIGADDRPRQS